MSRPRQFDTDWIKRARERDAAYLRKSEELDLTPRETVQLAVGYLLICAFVVACIVAPLAVGGLILAVFGW